MNALFIPLLHLPYNFNFLIFPEMIPHGFLFINCLQHIYIYIYRSHFVLKCKKTAKKGAFRLFKQTKFEPFMQFSVLFSFFLKLQFKETFQGFLIFFWRQDNGDRNLLVFGFGK